MTNCCKNYKLGLVAITILAWAGLMTFGGCTDVNDTIGSDLIPENQKMKIRIDTLDNFFTYITQTDSVSSGDLGYGYMGHIQNDTFGLRRCSFISQVLPSSLPYRAGFGLDPIFDSVQFTLSIDDYIGDTTVAQRFLVYEVLSDDFIPEDSAFYVNFDPAPYISAEPLFEFEFNSPSKTAVTAKPTEKGKEYVKRLLETDTTTYYNDTLWLNKFHGLYIVPAEDNVSSALYKTGLSYTGLQLWLRDHDSIDHNLIYDTISASYVCFASDATIGNISGNIVSHDYAGSLVGAAGVNDTLPTSPTDGTIYVEGLGGVTGYMKVTDRFVEILGELSDEAANGGYSNLAINQAMMYIPVDGDKNNLQAITPLLNAAPERLGIYTNYKALTGIPDYDHQYESDMTTYYGSKYTLPYDGYMNRSLASYTMDITSYVQRMWVALQDNGGDVSKIDDRSLFIAPEATDLFTFKQVALKGNENIRVVITYTLLK